MTDETNISALSARAASGDAAAQYALAATYSRARNREEADRWLRAAANSGHPDALYTLATRQLSSESGALGAASLLAEAADRGSSAAVRLLAVLTATGVGIARDENGAINSVLKLARGGNESAKREIACLLAISDPHHDQIVSVLQSDETNDPVAAAFRIAREIEGRAAGDRSELESARLLLSKLRYPRAQSLASALNSRVTPEATAAPLDWRAIVASISLAPRIAAAPQRLSEAPDAVVYRAAIAPEVCEYLIAHAAARLGPSLVYDPIGRGMIRDPLRTSLTASLGPIDLDLALIALSRAMAGAAGEPDERGEFLSVLQYTPGQQYRPHFDSIPPGPDLDQSGQRTKTAILFLNDDFVGGETHFLLPDVKLRASRGDILVFSSFNAKGELDPASRHAGLPVTAGQKWIVTRWFRSKKYMF